jgi:hypothetical protein
MIEVPYMEDELDRDTQARIHQEALKEQEDLRIEEEKRLKEEEEERMVQFKQAEEARKAQEEEEARIKAQKEKEKAECFMHRPGTTALLVFFLKFRYWVFFPFH